MRTIFLSSNNSVNFSRKLFFLAVFDLISERFFSFFDIIYGVDLTIEIKNFFNTKSFRSDEVKRRREIEEMLSYNEDL